MIPKDNRRITILDRINISTKEVILYLESLNAANAEVLKVLKKKPALPGYEHLPWVIEFRKQVQITEKLKTNKKLTSEERLGLRKVLVEAAKRLNKLRGCTNAGIEMYLKELP